MGLTIFTSHAFAIQAHAPTGTQGSYFASPTGEVGSPSLGAESDSQFATCCNQQEVPSLLDRLDQNTEETRAKGARWFLSEYDFDSRGFNVLHFIGSSPLPYGFDLWGFIDIEGTDLAGSDREDLSSYFREMDVKT